MNAVEFLQKFHPNRPWVLTAIAPDRKGIETKAFTDPGAAEKWVKKYEGKRNLYFSVGEVIHAEDKKASKDNIKAVHWLHVDIDAGAGDLLAELERIKALVTTKLPMGVPKPTCVIYSGGGYQAFWRLSDPVVIQGNAEAAKHVERYNKQLEILFGGDQCHNVDRIMRLPYTTNLPNAQKVAKGRVPVQATVLYFDDKSHDLPSFDQAADVALPVGDVSLDIPSNIPRLNSVDDLDEWKVPDRVKVIIVQGFHPDEPKEGDESRSAWVFDVSCNLVRSNCPDEVIYSVLTDPNFKISESVREASDVDRYAKRQITNAKEAVESEWLHNLNQKFAVIGNWGGKCRVAEEVYDESLGRQRLVKQSFEDFRNRYMNQYEMVADGDKIKQIPVGKWWLQHPKRRQFDRLIFAPGEDHPDAYNLWRGFGCNAIPGDRHELLLDHMQKTICCGVEAHYEYLIGWMAMAVQKPAIPGATAVVMRGKQGTGKSFLAKHFGKLFGRHFLHVSNGSHLTGNFNSHLRDAIVVFGDEAFYAGDKRHESVLKTLITEETLMIEAKGVDAEASPNYTHLMLASNNAWVVPAGASERRFFVLDVMDDYARDTVHFAKIANALENGGYENLLHFLLNYDLTGYNSQDVPNTKALDEQKALSLEPEEQWWLSCLMDASFGPGLPWGVDGMQISNAQLYQSYMAAAEHVPAHRKLGRIQFLHFIKRMAPTAKSIRMRHDGEAHRGKVLAPIHVARTFWTDFHRTSQSWDDIGNAEEESNLPF